MICLRVALGVLILIVSACSNGSESSSLPTTTTSDPTTTVGESAPDPDSAESLPGTTTSEAVAPAETTTTTSEEVAPAGTTTTSTEAVAPTETTTTTSEAPPVTAAGATSANRHYISVNGHHSCIATEIGEVYCWGNNDSGQLGNGEMGAEQHSSKPLKVAGISDAVSVATGWEHSCAVHRSGRMSCWGDNNRGELGDGMMESVALEPVSVIGIDDAVDADAGDWHTCAVQRSGQVSCWGWNAAGQLGRGAEFLEAASSTPARVDGISDAVSVALGSEHSCALHATGEVSCWGDNFFGELGTGVSGPYERSLAPEKVVGISDAVAIDTSIEHSCAVHETGKISCWGANSSGQLGNNSTEDETLPQQVVGIDDAVDISVGASFSCAVRRGGAVYCWGSNTLGALGSGEQNPFDPDSSFWNSMSPLQVLGISDVVDISSGPWFTCALAKDGEAYCWGSNLYGELGAGIMSKAVSAPRGVAGIDDAVAVSSAFNHSCIVHATGNVTCWGDYWRGTLGDIKAAEISEVRPVQIVDLDDAVDVDAEGVSCALRESGTVACWGALQVSPYTVAEDGGISPTLTEMTFRTDVTKVAVGGRGHACFLHENGEVTCAGSNSLGQLGNESVEAFTMDPVPATGITDAVDLAAGYTHTCVAHEGGEVSCWGSNLYGQLGNGEEGEGSERFEPVKVQGIEDAAAVAANHFNSCVLHESGEVSCWGANWSSQLGANAPASDDHSSVPVSIPDVVDVVEVSVGSVSTCVLDSAGEVFCWGSNHTGELGTLSPMPDDQSRTPVKVEGVEDVASISVGTRHVCAAHTDGSVTCWGWNALGQVGSGSISEEVSSYEPVKVAGLGLSN